MPRRRITACERRFVERGEGHDLGQGERLEGKLQARARRLGRVAAAPVLTGEPPGDLRARGEVRLETRRRKPDAAEKFTAGAVLHGPQSEAARGELPLQASGEVVALGPAQAARHELHGHRVGMQGGKGHEIRLAPLAQREPRGRQGVHRCLQGTRMPVLSNA
jgi:hypothetical protein